MENILHSVSSSDILALDFETVEGIDIDIFSLGVLSKGEYFAEAYEPTIKNLDQLYKILHKVRIVIFQNATFDLKVLDADGFPVEAIRDKVHDTMIMAHLVDENRRKGLKVRCQDVGMELTDWKEASKGTREEYLKYAAEDAMATIKLFYKYGGILKSEDLFTVYEMERRLIYVTLRMEQTGMYIDAKKSNMMYDTAEKRLKRLKVEIYKLNDGPFNLNSTQQMAIFLFKKMRVKRKSTWTTPKGNVSTNEKVLKEIAERDAGTPAGEVVGLLLEHRRLAKLMNTFIGEAILKFADNKGRVHPNFNQVGTVTGRYSSSAPNAHNVSNDSVVPIKKTKKGKKIKPKIDTRIRSQVVPAKGWKMAVFDYSQIELRIVAHLSQDPTMLQIYRDGGDLHEEVSKRMGCTRTIAKNINFGIIYGMAPFTFARNYGTTEAEAEAFFAEHKKRFPRVWSTIATIHNFVKDYGYVRTYSGRKRRLPDAMQFAHKGKHFGALRQSVNTPVQGSAADLIKMAMIDLYEKMPKTKVRMIAQVHDELIFELKSSKYLKDIKYIVENALVFDDVKFEADVKMVSNWAEGKED